MSIQRWLNHSGGVHVAFSALAMLVALGWASSASAGFIVNDTWIDDEDATPASPTYSEYGTDSDADGDLESAWLQGGIGTLDPVAGGGPGPLRGDLTALAASSATWTTYFTPEGSELKLLHTGDLIRVTWKFSVQNVNVTVAGGAEGSNTSQNFRFAVVDADVAAGGSRGTANGSLPSVAYKGYAVLANMGKTLGNNNPFQLRERTLLTPGNLLNTTGDFGGILGNGATTGNHGYDSDTPYTLVWEMTRNGTALDMDVKLSGGTLDNDGLAEVVFSDPSPSTFKYDTFGLRPSGATTTAQIFDTSLFRVELIPEPASLALMGLGGLAILGLLRRRR